MHLCASRGWEPLLLGRGCGHRGCGILGAKHRSSPAGLPSTPVCWGLGSFSKPSQRADPQGGPQGSPSSLKSLLQGSAESSPWALQDLPTVRLCLDPPKHGQVTASQQNLLPSPCLHRALFSSWAPTEPPARSPPCKRWALQTLALQPQGAVVLAAHPVGFLLEKGGGNIDVHLPGGLGGGS